MVPLGNRSAVIPSAVSLGDDGLLVGEAASARSVTDAKRVAREFKRRIGDPTALLGDHAAHELNGLLCAGIVRAVQDREGTAPAELILSHPAAWTTAKRQLFVDGITSVPDVDWPPIRTVSEPEAAAVHYAMNERVEPGAVVAVYDLGGGTFDAAVLRRNEGGAGFEMIGQPEGIDRLGGIDFDAAIVAYVNRHLDGALDGLDTADPSVAGGLARLRTDCTDAKQALSTDTDVRIPVLVPGIAQTEVRITRSEFETMIQPALGETVGALRRALRSAGVAPGEISAVLLIGGSSRIPLVAQLVGAELGRPVAVDAHPKHGVSLGAALSSDVEPAERSATYDATVTSTETAAPDVHDRAPAAPDDPRPEPASTRTGPRRGLVVAAAASIAAIAAIAAVGGFALSRRSADVNVGAGASSSSSSLSASSTSAPVSTSASASTSTSTSTTVLGSTAVATTPGTVAGRVAPISATPSATPPADCPTTLPAFACITAIGVDEAQNLIVPFTVVGYDPLIGVEPNRHVHFYFNVGPMAANQLNAGSNGPDPADWVQWDVPNPMGPGGAQRGYTVADARDVKATELCILVADALHAVVAGSGNCMALPAAVIATS